MKKFFVLLFCLFFILTGCSSLNVESAKNNIKIEVEKFYENLLLEDLDSVMKQISTDSDQYYHLYDEYRTTFQDFNYSYNLKEISFNEITDDRVIVSTSLTINGVDEDDKFDSFEVIQVFSFKPISENLWKISSLETKYEF